MVDHRRRHGCPRRTGTGEPVSQLTPERRIDIHTLLQELSDYWHDHPEMRLGQIIFCLTASSGAADIFYNPDGEYTAALAEMNKLTAFGSDAEASK